MKVSIIGAGDLEKICGSSETCLKDLKKLMSDVVKALVDAGAEIIILPARGVPYEFAKMYKKAGGKKVHGVIPAKCPFYGKYTMAIIGKFLDTKKEFPATGISFGVSVIIEALKEKTKKTVVELYVIPIKTLKQSLKIGNVRSAILYFRMIFIHAQNAVIRLFKNYE